MAYTENDVYRCVMRMCGTNRYYFGEAGKSLRDFRGYLEMGVVPGSLSQDLRQRVDTAKNNATNALAVLVVDQLRNAPSQPPITCDEGALYEAAAVILKGCHTCWRTKDRCRCNDIF